MEAIVSTLDLHLVRAYCVSPTTGISQVPSVISRSTHFQTLRCACEINVLRKLHEPSHGVDHSQPPYILIFHKQDLSTLTESKWKHWLTFDNTVPNRFMETRFGRRRQRDAFARLHIQCPRHFTRPSPLGGLWVVMNMFEWDRYHHKKPYIHTYLSNQRAVREWLAVVINAAS